MHLTWLKAFHLVAAEGGFTAASRSLHVSQPTVSSHVKALEQHFDVELFFRRGHSIELTPLGQTLYLITSSLFGHEQEAIAVLRAAKTFGEGELKLTAVGPHDVMELAGAIKRLHPRLKVAVSIGHAPEVLRDLVEYKADVAVMAHEPLDRLFHSVRFNRHRVLVIANHRHRLSKQRSRSVSIKQLAGEKVVIREPLSTTRQAFIRACERSGVKIKIVMEINSREAVVEAVSLGLGISVVSEAELTGHPKLRALEVSDAEMFVESHIVCLAERRNRPMIKAFFDMAATVTKT